MKHTNLFLLVFIIGTCLTGSAQSAPIAEAETVTSESIASLPFDRRVCRIGMECLRPVGYGEVVVLEFE